MRESALAQLPSYLLPLPRTVLNPLQEHIAVARPGDPLETRDVVVVDVDVKRRKVTLDVVPLSKGLQGRQQGFVLDPREEFGGRDHVVHYALWGGRRLFCSWCAAGEFVL